MVVKGSVDDDRGGEDFGPRVIGLDNGVCEDIIICEKREKNI